MQESIIKHSRDFSGFISIFEITLNVFKLTKNIHIHKMYGENIKAILFESAENMLNNPQAEAKKLAKNGIFAMFRNIININEIASMLFLGIFLKSHILSVSIFSSSKLQRIKPAL